MLEKYTDVTDITDINLEHSWMRRLPRHWHPYLILIRFDRPVGLYLGFLPALMGLNLANHYLPAEQQNFSDWLVLCVILFVGAWAMRSAGCIWNDWCDRKLDARVGRTRERPLASGALSAVRAFGLMAALLLLAASLLLFLPLSVLWVAVVIVPCVLLYPMMKYWINAPQLWLGLTFNAGVWIAWFAVHGLDHLWPPLLLYLGCFCWTLAYDTVYALQDVRDDAQAHIGSLALSLGRVRITGIGVFYFFCGSFWLALLSFMDKGTDQVEYAWMWWPSGIFALAWLYLAFCAYCWYCVVHRQSALSVADDMAAPEKPGNESFAAAAAAAHGRFFRQNAIFGLLVALVWL